MSNCIICRADRPYNMLRKGICAPCLAMGMRNNFVSGNANLIYLHGALKEMRHGEREDINEYLGNYGHGTSRFKGAS